MKKAQTQGRVRKFYFRREHWVKLLERRNSKAPKCGISHSFERFEDAIFIVVTLVISLFSLNLFGNRDCFFCEMYVRIMKKCMYVADLVLLEKSLEQN